ncbi:MAG: indolepyruvate oxidoreductase subunit beta [Clostridiales bacterium]|jgi:indolepyruvate ferredoxin oxidoreductase beta subunit|nr:indolepyruvate oxidoreductase subunit beta [Clostridiales bacterium]
MKTQNILIAGVGGQGTLLASRVLGNLFLNMGYDVKISEVHGMAQRGGSVVTHVKYGERVYSPLVETGCADILLAFEKLEAIRWIHYLREGGMAVVNTQEIDPMPVILGTQQYPSDLDELLLKLCPNSVIIDALNIAKDLGNIRVVNTVLMGALACYLDIDTTEWEKAIKATVPPKTIDINLQAFYSGYNACRSQSNAPF